MGIVSLGFRCSGSTASWHSMGDMAFQRYGAGQTLRDKSSREVALPWVRAFLLVVLTTVFCALLASMSFQYYAAWLFVFVMAVAVLGSIAMAALFSPGILIVLLVWLN
ncbi:hypothetical protein FRC0190_01697 [Corynebacterium rouxii]|uniref:Uncharacterized protein n=2 Tax=Corynebacterium rouxii TaxID=2719119 RepID=A0A6I8MDD2_9CORY|nr:hypothetical protein FRC0190_01697 [Corynebacterium rouxii]